MKVAVVTGLCIEHDAISDAVREQRRALMGAGHGVTVFAQVATALGTHEVFETADPWWLSGHPDYATADLVIFHHGIHYELFNALLLAHEHAVKVVQFHNVTPPDLLTGSARSAAVAGLDQLSIAAKAHRAWCDSVHNADVLLAHSDIDPEDVRVVPLGVPGLELPATQKDTADRKGIVTVGRLVEAKGLRSLIEAYARLDADIRVEHPLRIVGRRMQSEAEFPERLESLAAELGVDDEVSIEVGLESAERDRIYRESLVFATASLHEGVCIPVIEALAHGCRVVCTDAGVLPETAGDVGVVVPAGDTSALSTALGRAMRSSHDADVQSTVEHVRTYVPEVADRRTVFEAENALRHGRGRTMEELRSDRVGFAVKQQRLLDALGCPQCRTGLAVRDAVEVSGSVAAAELVCATHGRVGTVGDFRPGFLERNLAVGSPRDAVDQRADLVRDVTRLGKWREVPEGILADGTEGESLVFECSGGGFRLTFLGHEWSGARIEIEGVRSIEVDLHRSPVEDIVVEVEDLAEGIHRVSLVASGVRSAGSNGSQVVVRSIRREIPVEDLRPPGLGLVNRGNPYPDRFPELVSDMTEHGIALDCGGGDRRFGDDRVFNLEYMDYELPDIYGDGLALPFQDDTFDLIQSQAVLEHVPDPQRAVDEMIRVTKPGGLLYLEVAFMQPLHAVPSHYMNVTPHGIEHLCRELEVIEQGEFGGLAETIGWIGGLVDAEEKLGTDRFAEVISSLAELDSRLSTEELRMAASAVFLLGRKA